MVPLDRIELSTSALPRMRSTTELQRRRRERGLLADGPAGVKHKRSARLTPAPVAIPTRPMTEGDETKADPPPPAKSPNRSTSVEAREARLAQALRANLRRRKAATRGKAD